MFTLAAKLGMTVAQLSSTLSAKELSEWIAYEATLNEEWVHKYNSQKEQETVDNMSDEEVQDMILGLGISRVKD